VQDFKKLKVWEKSHQLTVAVYRATASFPKDELYGLTSQIRRSCSSIPANIAEGCGRGGKTEFARFLQVAMGSANELEYHLLLAYDLGLVENIKYKLLSDQAIELERMLASLLRKVRTGN
jgi:four helix bundle protein